jgi:hypothetical protein
MSLKAKRHCKRSVVEGEMCGAPSVPESRVLTSVRSQRETARHLARGVECMPAEPLVQRELISTGCITFFTTYSPIASPIPVPTRVEKR